MKKILFSILALAILFAMYSCKDTNGPDNTATVNLRSQLENNTAKLSTIKFTDGITKSYVDSVQIKRIRILITEVKFHLAKESDSLKDKLYKSGPLMFVADSTGNYLEIASGTIPAGAYNKLKFEIHRFESSVLSQYTNSTLFKEFATPERYSVIIDGIAYDDGVGIRFTYNGTPTVNLTYKFPTSIEFPENEETNFYLMINPLDIFKAGNEIFNPMDASNHNDIDNLIKSAIKALKKNI